MSTILESLEPRRLLAGNVTITADASGDLLVQGDSKSNHIAVVGSAAGYQITGTDTGVKTALSNTPVAGGVFIPAAQKSIAIDLANGDDALQLSGLTDGADCSIQTGNGNDQVVLLNESHLTGTMNINTGNGNDLVRFSTVEFFDAELSVNLGNGEDAVQLDTTVYVVLSSATIDGGGSRDTIVNESLFANASSTIELLLENHLP
jgi:hypothetical protein